MPADLVSTTLHTRRTLLLLTLLVACRLPAHAQFYAGALGGVSTLSGDARSVFTPGGTNFSLYNPENGPVLNLLIGKHVSDYFAVQADYVWNRNLLTLSSSTLSNGSRVEYQQTRSSAQQSVFGNVLVYFRDRESKLRPYLSVGMGLVHLSSSEEQVSQLLGAPPLPPQRFSSNMIALRVPVGMDVDLGRKWVFRYTFSETLSKNPISDRLTPPGQHSLKNFQNLFGVIRRF